MRCQYCNAILSQEEYAFDKDRGEFLEQGRHEDGHCIQGNSLEWCDSLGDFADELPTAEERLDREDTRH